MADKTIKKINNLTMGMTPIEVVCYQCDKTFMGAGTRTFCSQICQRDYTRRRNLAGRKSRTKPTPPVR